MDTLNIKQYAFVFLLILTIFGLSQSAFGIKTIYGVGKLNAQNGNIKPGYQIQVASFRHAKNATQYKQQLESHIKNPIKIIYQNGFYRVMALPLTPPISNPIAKPIKNTLIKKQRFKEQYSFSQSNLQVHNTSTPKWFITAGSGAQFPTVSSSMTVKNGSNFTPPHDVDTFTTPNLDNTAILFFSAGRRWETESTWVSAYSLGIYYQYLFSNQLQGSITQYSTPAFENYAYTWSTTSNVILGSAKANLMQYNRFSPYLTGGLGIALNQSANYTETAYSGVTPRDNPDFSGSQSAQFAYQAGVGLDIKITDPLFASIGYLYQNIGSVSGQGHGPAWTGTTLSLGSVAQNEIVASLSYLFE